MTQQQQKSLFAVALIAVIMAPLWVMLLGWPGLYICLAWAALRGTMEYNRGQQ